MLDNLASGMGSPPSFPPPPIGLDRVHPRVDYPLTGRAQHIVGGSQHIVGGAAATVAQLPPLSRPCFELLCQCRAATMEIRFFKHKQAVFFLQLFF